MVLVTQNIVRAAAWLLFTLAGTSILYFLLGADFVGAAQLIVYVGGTLVLVVFGVMLTAQGPFISMKTGAAEWGIGVLVGILLFSALVATTVLSRWPTQTPSEIDAATAPNTVQLGQAFLGVRDATIAAPLSGLPPGSQQRPREQVAYLLPFEIISVHLTVVLIGAAYLARAKRRRAPTSSEVSAGEAT
jgi:NADH-quinone oxidoreductase subunit J